MLSLSLYAVLKLSKTKSLQKKNHDYIKLLYGFSMQDGLFNWVNTTAAS